MPTIEELEPSAAEYEALLAGAAATTDQTEAAALYERAAEAAKAAGDAANAALCFTHQANCLLELELYEPALAASDQAVAGEGLALDGSADAVYYGGWATRGSALGGLGRFAEAVQSLQQALARSPPAEQLEAIHGNLEAAQAMAGEEEGGAERGQEGGLEEEQAAVPLFAAVGAPSAAAVTWSHATNSRALLGAALAEGVHFLEVDVMLEGGERGEPICAHPPELSSDLSVAQLLEIVCARNGGAVVGGPVGLKLDFKDAQAVAPCLALLADCNWRVGWALMLNADVWTGPGGADVSKSAYIQAGFEARRFCEQCARDKVGRGATLSLGWTTGAGEGETSAATRALGLQGYSARAHIEPALADVAAAAGAAGTELRVSFAVRAGCLRRSKPAAIAKLLEAKAHSLTVWGEDDFRRGDFIGAGAAMASGQARPWVGRAFFDLKRAALPFALMSNKAKVAAHVEEVGAPAEGDGGAEDVKATSEWLLALCTRLDPAGTGKINLEAWTAVLVLLMGEGATEGMALPVGQVEYAEVIAQLLK